MSVRPSRPYKMSLPPCPSFMITLKMPTSHLLYNSKSFCQYCNLLNLHEGRAFLSTRMASFKCFEILLFSFVVVHVNYRTSIHVCISYYLGQNKNVLWADALLWYFMLYSSFQIMSSFKIKKSSFYYCFCLFFSLQVRWGFLHN